jgi:hypothetical protein
MIVKEAFEKIYEKYRHTADDDAGPPITRPHK